MHNVRPLETVGESASEAVYFGAADVVIVSHRHDELAIALQRAAAAADAPILVGGHATADNVLRLLQHADRAIVGEAFKPRASETDARNDAAFPKPRHGNRRLRRP